MEILIFFVIIILMIIGFYQNWKLIKDIELKNEIINKLNISESMLCSDLLAITDGIIANKEFPDVLKNAARIAYTGIASNSILRRSAYINTSGELLNFAKQGSDNFKIALEILRASEKENNNK